MTYTPYTFNDRNIKYKVEHLVIYLGILISS